MLKETIQTFFKKQSFKLEPRATLYILDALEKVDNDKHSLVMGKIITELMEQNLDSNIISFDIIKNTVKCLTSSNLITLFQVIDAFQVPILKYNGDLKRFYVKDKGVVKHISTLFSDNDSDKSTVLKDRYKFIKERLKRNGILNFNCSEGDSIGLKTIEFLISSGTKGSKVMVLGMLTQQQEGVWCLEDDSDIVKIKIDNTEYHKGLVLEGSFVLAEGFYEDGIFKIGTIGLPPLESGQMSCESILTRTNHFGGLPVDCTVKLCPQMTKLSNKNMSGKTLVFISEIWFDKEIIFTKLETLFSGYTSLKPGAFIFCGNFLSPDTINAPESVKLKTIKRAMKRIVLLFAVFRELALNSHLIFVPGPNDPFQSNKNVLPRAALSTQLLLDPVFNGVIPNLKDSEKVELRKRVIMATNPCRITYYNKEIVVFRDTIAHKIYRHCMYIPTDNQTSQESMNIDDSLNTSVNNTLLEDSERDAPNKTSQTNFLEYQLVWTLLSQAHLMPLPLHVSPVYWGHDQALRLFPTPDLVVLADPSLATFDIKVSDCMFINPQSFSSGEGFNFKIYYPYNGDIESCSLDV